MNKEMCNDELLDEEVDEVTPVLLPKPVFSKIESNESGLRDYQKEIKIEVYDQWSSFDNVMLQMPTGTGKTIVFTSIVRDILHWCVTNSPKSKILIVAHRKELIRQASEKLEGIDHGIIQSGQPLNLSRPVQVASIQTFMSRRHYDLMREQYFDYIIIDEAHHSLASGYQKLWDMFPSSKKLGVTATPWRMNHAGFTDLFETIVLSHSIEWFVNESYLSNYDYISIRMDSDIQKRVNAINKYGIDGDYLESELSNRFDVDKIRAQLYKNYKQFALGKKGIIYAIDRKHAEHIRELYSSNGVKICMIDGTTPQEERDRYIAEFKANKLQVIVNVNIFSEGFDCPDIEFVQLARPTKSLSMYLQQVGRALRISPNKEKSIILDNVGLYNRFGTPMANRNWLNHFYGDGTSRLYNDGSGVNRNIMFEETDERQVDYTEGNDQMLVVEHAEGGEQIRPLEAESAIHMSDYNVFQKDGLYGICDQNGRVKIPAIYEELRSPFGGYVPFKRDNLWGIMLINGTIKVKAKYYFIGPCLNGRIEIKNQENSDSYYIDKNLHKIS